MHQKFLISSNLVIQNFLLVKLEDKKEYTLLEGGLNGITQRLPLGAEVLGHGLDGAAQRRSTGLGVPGQTLDGAPLEAGPALGRQVGGQVAGQVVGDRQRESQAEGQGPRWPAHCCCSESISGRS